MALAISLRALDDLIVAIVWSKWQGPEILRMSEFQFFIVVNCDNSQSVPT